MPSNNIGVMTLSIWKTLSLALASLLCGATIITTTLLPQAGAFVAPYSTRDYYVPRDPLSLQLQQPQRQLSSKLFFFNNILESMGISTATTSPTDNTNKSKSNGVHQERDTLKKALLEVCAANSNSNNQQNQRQQKRAAIEAIIQQLAPLSPTPASAASPLLQKQWKLVWTTEKEINFFLDAGWSNDIGQTIQGSRIDNSIEFVQERGGFYVSGKLTVPDPQGPRTEFEFETARLDLMWAQLNFPPVGAGWFDTVYLDDTLRVDVNSRNDILICTPYATS